MIDVIIRTDEVSDEHKTVIVYGEPALVLAMTLSVCVYGDRASCSLLRCGCRGEEGWSEGRAGRGAVEDSGLGERDIGSVWGLLAHSSVMVFTLYCPGVTEGRYHGEVDSYVADHTHHQAH